MKRYLFLLFAFSIFSNLLHAQEKENVLKINMFGLFVGQSQLSYERAFNENFSVQISAGYISRTQELSFGQDGGIEYMTKGFILIPEARYYFSDVIDGFYAAAFLRYRSTQLEVEYDDEPSYKRDRNSAGGGLLIGYQVLLGDADIVALDIFIGPQYKAVNQAKKEYYDGNSDPVGFDDNELKIEKEGIGVRFGMNIGIAF